MTGLVDLGVVGTPTYLGLDANGVPQQILNKQGAVGLGGFQTTQVFVTGPSTTQYQAPPGCRQLSVENVATVALGTVLFPVNPVDGDVFAVSTRSQITTCTFTAVGLNVRNAPANPFTAGSTAKWMYSDGSRANSPAQTWLRIA